VSGSALLDKVAALAETVRAHVRPGQTLLVAGFGRGGVPFSILEFLAQHPAHFGNLTLVKNDANEPGIGIGLLIEKGMVRRLISTHVGLNPDFIARMNKGEIACEFVPQGIFAERLRAGGAGIPAFLTDIGMGTIVAEGKPTIELDGRTWLIERALRGDVALLCADVADRAGNCWWRGSNRNMSVVMGTAAEVVIVEAKQIVDVGTLEPENIHLPGVFVQAVVQATPRTHLNGQLHEPDL
jgi:acetate CoA/acetoacetate CoA-transferase alpha subunit